MSRIGHDVIGTVTKSLGLSPKSRYEKWWETKGKLIYDRLSKKSVKSVSFDGQFIEVEFNGEKLRNEVKRIKSEPWVGSFSRTKAEVYYDDDLTPSEFVVSILVHETLEKYFKERWGLDENSHGHSLADSIERTWFLPKFGKQKWNEYSEIVEKIHRLELQKLEGKPYKHITHK